MDPITNNIMSIQREILLLLLDTRSTKVSMMSSVPACTANVNPTPADWDKKSQLSADVTIPIPSDTKKSASNRSIDFGRILIFLPKKFGSLIA